MKKEQENFKKQKQEEFAKKATKESIKDVKQKNNDYRFNIIILDGLV